MAMDRIVIAGGGVAAHGAVTGLRHAGFQGEVVVVGREPHRPYERPHLSKRYLLREVAREQLFLPELEAELRLGEEVVELEPDRHAVRLAGGDRLEYGRLLLATGARPRLLPGHEGRLYLRELGDADRLRDALDRGEPLELVGAGFIGCEVAAAARRRGLPVTVHEALDLPLLRVLGRELGAWLADVHRGQGVDLRTGVRELPPLGEAALVGVGTQPNVELAVAAGIRCEQGIVVDELGRTDAPDVYAAGDCARFWSPLFEAAVRVEHYQTAHRHGAATGRAMAGDERPFAEAPWFWSDQYDLNLQYVGAALPWERSLARGRLGEPPFTLLFLQDGRLVGALGVNDGRTVSQLRRLLEARVEVDAEQLADPAIDLKRLARPSAPR
ncbi:MAG TPA: FAD-dependent oxidoreductase [Candidatus Dormibacteraeota bacterium]|nr:FAD-dependent oxidoreductase [Candidatus Dormibacteraeota bacterium]